jgi:hypothetical protein
LIQTISQPYSTEIEHKTRKSALGTGGACQTLQKSRNQLLASLDFEANIV